MKPLDRLRDYAEKIRRCAPVEDTLEEIVVAFEEEGEDRAFIRETDDEDRFEAYFSAALAGFAGNPMLVSQRPSPQAPGLQVIVCDVDPQSIAKLAHAVAKAALEKRREHATSNAR